MGDLMLGRKDDIGWKYDCLMVMLEVIHFLQAEKDICLIKNFFFL